MSQKLEDAFGERVIHARNVSIHEIQKILAGEELSKGYRNHMKRIIAFLETLTPTQKEEFLHALKWGVDRSFFDLMVFFTQGEAELHVKMGGCYLEEEELLTDTQNGQGIIPEECYFDWVEKWGDPVP